MALNLFIDTNVLLSFYHFSGEDLEELKKLAALLKSGHVRLFIPAQVVDEFRRNREVKIADALRGLREQKLPAQFPRFCQDYAEFAAMRDLQKEYEKAHSALLQKTLADASGGSLKADAIIEELFALGDRVACDAPLVDRARARMAIGNPPGKNGSLGDAVNWECLLEAVPDTESLHFVTDDGDYASPLDRDVFRPFLSDEWATRKSSALISYHRLSAFFATHFPQIKLASEIEKELLIQELAQSGGFTRTHILVGRLRNFGEFTADQANAILAAAANNTQVGWIASDWDVRELMKSAISGNEAALDQALLEEVTELMGPEPEPF